jgi:hypothetical protein
MEKDMMMNDSLMKPLPPEPPAPVVRTRLKISDIAWGVFWGLTAWTVIAFFTVLFLLTALNVAGS